MSQRAMQLDTYVLKGDSVRGAVCSCIARAHTHRHMHTQTKQREARRSKESALVWWGQIAGARFPTALWGRHSTELPASPPPILNEAGGPRLTPQTAKPARPRKACPADPAPGRHANATEGRPPTKALSHAECPQVCASACRLGPGPPPLVPHDLQLGEPPPPRGRPLLPRAVGRGRRT